MIMRIKEVVGERKEIRMDLGDGNKIIVSKKNG